MKKSIIAFTLALVFCLTCISSSILAVSTNVMVADDMARTATEGITRKGFSEEQEKIGAFVESYLYECAYSIYYHEPYDTQRYTILSLSKSVLMNMAALV